MAEPLYDNKTLRRYLLGTASVDEADRLDELSLTDDDCALALASAENDLVDAYARTSLIAAERAQFEQHYLASPLRREKSHFAVELQRIGNRVAADLPTGKREMQRGPARFLWFTPSLLWQGGLAMAALALLAAGVWLIAENRRLRHEAGAERSSLLQRVSELQAGQTVTESNQAELARLRERLAQLEARPFAPTVPPAASAVHLFNFTLAAPIRGTGLPRIEIQNQVSAVAVKLELETDAYPSYRVVLRDPLTNRVLWQSGKLAAAKDRNGASLNVRLPASLFATQRYAFELTGNAANNAEERIGSYSFEVRRP